MTIPPASTAPVASLGWTDHCWLNDLQDDSNTLDNLLKQLRQLPFESPEQLIADHKQLVEEIKAASAKVSEDLEMLQGSHNPVDQAYMHNHASEVNDLILGFSVGHSGGLPSIDNASHAQGLDDMATILSYWLDSTGQGDLNNFMTELEKIEG